MENMFNNCNNLKVLDLSNFDTSNVHNVDNMFAGCDKLVYLKLYPYEGKEIFYNLEHYKTICTDDFEKLKEISPQLDNDYTVNNCSIFPFKYNTSDDTSIIFSYSPKPKNEIFNDLDYLLYNSDSYIIYGDDYVLVIKPLNQFIEESTVNIDFANCEKILKRFYPDYKFKIMQINLKNNIEGHLTDQVEYKIFNQYGEEMDLSICKDVNILIEYSIKNPSSLNIEKIISYKNKGIDILNINDNFFNDICFPYSDPDSNSDVILNDRVTDIYNNYSLCDKGCEYQSFDVEKMCVYCSCEVKEKVSYKLHKGNFKTYMKHNFFKSNFGVIKCYNLVFGIKRKLNNVAFWLFLIMTILHIPIYYFYFGNGINRISNYIDEEMTKKGYNDKEIISSSKRIKLNKNKKGNKLISRRLSGFIIKHNINNNPPKKEKEYLYFSDRTKNNTGNFVKVLKDNVLTINNENIIPETDANDEFDINENIKKLTIETTEYNDEDKKDRKSLSINSKKSAKKFRRFSVLTNSNLLSEINSRDSLNSDNKNIKLKKRKSIIIKTPSKFSNNLILPKSKSENKGNVDDKQIEMKELPLILMNANNTEEHKPINSNYVINNFDYEEAIVHDKRNILRIFFILLISRENIFNLIFFHPPLKIKPLRICLFIFTYACDLALNALFYLTDNISDNYHYSGAHTLFFSFINNLTVSFASAVATFILLFFFRNLTHSSNSIKKLFREQDNLLKNDKKYIVKEITKMEIKNKIKKIMKCLKIKIIFFIVFELLLMIFFFYYTTAFCHVYESTQISWIIDSVTSFGISIITLIGISIISCILYKLSINFKQKLLYRIIMLLFSSG
jgi:surface protein